MRFYLEFLTFSDRLKKICRHMGIIGCELDCRGKKIFHEMSGTSIYFLIFRSYVEASILFLLGIGGIITRPISVAGPTSPSHF